MRNRKQNRKILRFLLGRYTAKLYVLKCWNGNETFYKIGITRTSISSRYSSFNALPYKWEVLYYQNGRAALLREAELVKWFHPFRYLPLNSFGGSRKECFRVNPLNSFKFQTATKNINKIHVSTWD